MATGEVVTKLQGMSIPFRRSGASDFATATEDAEIRSNVVMTLTTPIGFLPWRPEFGSKLSTLRHNLNSVTLREAARIHVIDALTRWVPYVRVVDVRVTSDRVGRKLSITIDYEIVRNGAGRRQVLSDTFITNSQ